MAIRDENLRWTKEAIRFSDNLKPMLQGNFKKAQEQGFSIEDWFYLITTEAHEVIMDFTLSTKKPSKEE